MADYQYYLGHLCRSPLPFTIFRKPNSKMSNPARQQRPSRGKDHANYQTPNWVFTLNNPDKCPPEQQPSAWRFKFLAYQKERGDSGTEHLQGYVIFNRKYSLNQVRKEFCNVAHWEVRKGSHEQALAYCTKEESRIGSPVIVGDQPEPGKRSDLLEVQQMLDSGCTIAELSREHFASFVKYGNGFREYKRLNAIKRNWKTEVTILYGDTGTGKTATIEQAYPASDNVYWFAHQLNGKWWDGYEGQETVVLDEFYGWLQHSFMLRAMDRYQLDAEIKGGFTNFAPKRMFITSNKHPKQWYKEKCDWPQFERRVENIIHLANVNGNTVMTIEKGQLDIPLFNRALLAPPTALAPVIPEPSPVSLVDLYTDEVLSPVTPPTQPNRPVTPPSDEAFLQAVQDTANAYMADLHEQSNQCDCYRYDGVLCDFCHSSTDYDIDNPSAYPDAHKHLVTEKSLPVQFDIPTMDELEAMDDEDALVAELVRTLSDSSSRNNNEPAIVRPSLKRTRAFWMEEPAPKRPRPTLQLVGDDRDIQGGCFCPQNNRGICNVCYFKKVKPTDLSNDKYKY